MAGAVLPRSALSRRKSQRIAYDRYAAFGLSELHSFEYGNDAVMEGFVFDRAAGMADLGNASVLGNAQVDAEVSRGRFGESGVAASEIIKIGLNRSTNWLFGDVVVGAASDVHSDIRYLAFGG